MRVLLIIAALMAVGWTASTSVEDVEFQAWKLEFGKSYGSEEEESQHKATWLANRKLIMEHNKLADQGIKSFRLGMNTFADMTTEEYRQEVVKNCLVSFNMTETHSAGTFFQQTEDVVLPETVDWRDKGYVTPVKSQGKCGSCWAFSAAGALEGQMFKKTGKLIPLSEQQLVDCSKSYGNKGCGGGLAIKAFTYITKSGGLESEKTYPYKAREGLCRFNRSNSVFKCRGFETIHSGDEKMLQKAVAEIGPIAVSIDAKHISFKHYKSGVHHQPNCTSKTTHAVLIVGYGTEKGQEYWLVKNSWGPRWGDQGYIKMARNKNNNCGIASMPAFPNV